MKGFIAGLIILQFLSGCVKHDHVGNGVRPPCTIDYIVHYESPNDKYTGKFRYNELGNPEAIIVDKENTGAPSYHFQYDEKGRLSAFLVSYNVERHKEIHDTIFAELHQYIYSNDVIVGDSIFFMTSLSNKYEQGYGVGAFKYDKWGRIIEYKLDINIPGFPVSKTYFYNYSNKNPYVKNQSVLGTHPILMFVNKDYNRKNEGVVEVNEYGLPTKFEYKYTGIIIEGGYEFGNFMKFHEVYYNCSSKGQ